MDFVVLRKRKRTSDCPKSTWRGKVKENLKVDLKEDAFNRTKWRRDVWILKNGVIPATCLDGNNIGQKLDMVMM